MSGETTTKRAMDKIDGQEKKIASKMTTTRRSADWYLKRGDKDNYSHEQVEQNKAKNENVQ